MNTVIPYLVLLATLGSGLVAGLLFIFSNTVMKALLQQPAHSGIQTMQAINALIINPVFMMIFLGTALLSALLLVYALMSAHAASALLIAATLLYVVGCFGVTMAFNVPLNNQLAKLDATQADAVEKWRDYVRAWLRWNHLRTVSAVLSACLYVLSYAALRAHA